MYFAISFKPLHFPKNINIAISTSELCISDRRILRNENQLILFVDKTEDFLTCPNNDRIISGFKYLHGHGDASATFFSVVVHNVSFAIFCNVRGTSVRKISDALRW